MIVAHKLTLCATNAIITRATKYSKNNTKMKKNHKYGGFLWSC